MIITGDPFNGVIFGTIVAMVGVSTYVIGSILDDPAGTITATFFIPYVNDGTSVVISDEDCTTVWVVGIPSHNTCNTLTKLDPVIVIVDPANFTIFGLIFVIIAVSTYVIVDGLDNPPTAFTFIWYVPIVDGGTIVDIVVFVNDVIANGDDPIVKDKGLCAVL